MRNPEATIGKILKKSGELFNTHGYEATSLRDITRATGYTKGAIYTHFRDKEHLEKEALLYLSEKMFGTLRQRIKKQATAPKKLRAVFSFFESYITDPPIKGGCPLLNAAVESDDAEPLLRRTALQILDALHGSLDHILRKGIDYGQIRQGTNTASMATLIIATLEGAIMMSKLRGKNDDIRTVIRHLDGLLKEIEI